MCYFVSNKDNIMIKNWTVITKQIKKKSTGLINYVNYLKDSNRPSHHGTKITVLNDASKEIVRAVDDLILHKIENKIKGRREPNNYATSFVLALPKNIQNPTLEQWKIIADDAVKNLAKSLNIDREKLKKLTHIVLHDEQKKASHVNIVVSNVIDNKVAKNISQFKATHTVKMSLNSSVKRLFNVCNTEYTPAFKSGLKQRSKPLFVARQDIADDLDRKITKMELALDVLKTSYFNIKSEISSWAKLFLSNDKLLESVTVKKAKNIAQNINDIEDRTPLRTAEIDMIISDIESKNSEPLKNTKVSEKRKKRRRKRD